MQFGYDKRGRIKNRSQAFQSGESVLFTKALAYGYDLKGGETR